MKNNTVVFIAISDYDNLGVGYMAAILSEAGFKTKIFDFRIKKSLLLNKLKKLDPLIIGFSIIFLNHLKQFTDLIEYLRKNEIDCHFTAGGHYASLRYEELFKLAPKLDSVIRFEGEYPMLELSKNLAGGHEWQNIKSLTYKSKDKIIANPVRPQEQNIDKFPFPSRSPLKKFAFKKKFTVILAGRGCTYNCTFCNTREFYRRASAPLKRIRNPEMVVSEMNYLFLKQRCSVFIFHDDDFPVKSTIQRDWISRFCNELERTGLHNKIIWKINCRPDEIEEKSFSLMKRDGLFLVFLGLEDGTDEGLKRLNKQSTVENSIRGITILKKLKIGFDYGFMLFQPHTTFQSLKENLQFLRRICDDGYTPVTFLKLIPLYGTRIEKELVGAGRLHQSNGAGDYDFPEEQMNRYYNFVAECFAEWFGSPEGVENISKWARNYLSVYVKYFEYIPQGIDYNKKVRKVIAKSNIFLLDTMSELSEIFRNDSHIENKKLLKNYRNRIKLKHDNFRNVIIGIMAKLLSYVEDNKIKTCV
jgi:radical SAM superfamily enzyme YgiQ (UPF0313 family)